MKEDIYEAMNTFFEIKKDDATYKYNEENQILSIEEKFYYRKRVFEGKIIYKNEENIIYKAIDDKGEEYHLFIFIETENQKYILSYNTHSDFYTFDKIKNEKLIKNLKIKYNDQKYNFNLENKKIKRKLENKVFYNIQNHIESIDLYINKKNVFNLIDEMEKIINKRYRKLLNKKDYELATHFINQTLIDGENWINTFIDNK